MFCEYVTVHTFVFLLALIYCCEAMKHIPIAVRPHMKCASNFHVLSAVSHLFISYPLLSKTVFMFTLGLLITSEYHLRSIYCRIWPNQV